MGTRGKGRDSLVYAIQLKSGVMWTFESYTSQVGLIPLLTQSSNTTRKSGGRPRGVQNGLIVAPPTTCIAARPMPLPCSGADTLSELHSVVGKGCSIGRFFRLRGVLVAPEYFRYRLGRTAPHQLRIAREIEQTQCNVYLTPTMFRLIYPTLLIVAVTAA